VNIDVQGTAVLRTSSYKNIHNLQISPGYIFRILQRFAVKFCSFTNFKMLFLTVVRDFLFLDYNRLWPRAKNRRLLHISFCFDSVKRKCDQSNGR
jgi:hypothetical protein